MMLAERRWRLVYYDHHDHSNDDCDDYHRDAGRNHYHDDEDHCNHDFRRMREVLLELDPRAKPSTD